MKRGTSYEFETGAAKINKAIDRVRQYREAVGDDVDLCIEIHRRLKPYEAITLAKGIEPYRPFFYEDPTMPENFDSMAYIAERIDIPIATGERFNILQEFAMLLERKAASFLRPDVCMCGGITGTKKIASLAEAYDVGIIPHNPLSPVSTAACLQVAANIPNFVIQEYPKGQYEPPVTEFLKISFKLEKGFLLLPDTPGIGVELIDEAVSNYPFKKRGMKACLDYDGSVREV